jgi:hypothetical protein
MGTKIYATSGDTNRTVGAVLSNDGVAVDLSAVDEIECHVRDRFSTALTTISGVTGNAFGQVSTTIPGPLVTGQYTLEWQVTAGSVITTYPGASNGRPQLIVRAEAD